LQLQLKKSNLETSVLSKYNRSILKLDATNLSLQWNQSKNTWFLPKWLQQRKIKNQLQAYAKNKLSDASVVDQLFSDLEDIEHVNLQLSNLVFSAMNILASQYATLDAIYLQRIQDDLKTIETIDGQLKSIASIDPQ